MTSERSKRRDFLSLIFISKSISKKLLIKNIFIMKNLTDVQKKVEIGVDWCLMTVVNLDLLSARILCNYRGHFA